MTERRRTDTAVQERRVTPELVRGALACIPPDVDRDTWARLAMAVKAELGPEGFDLWNDWSAQGQGYSLTAARDTWRSVKAGGGVTVGTLFGLAKDHGFRFPSDGPAAVRPTDADTERLAEAKRRQREAEEAEYRRRADDAAREAARLWAQASQTAPSPYLQRKGVQAHGVRCLSDGTLLVPMRNAAGELMNLQRIAADKPTDGSPDKRFLPGGRKTALWHCIGDPDGAPVLCLAEGYATAASVHEATGRPVVVAFDAGNLVHVARELRSLFPAAGLLVCADDDAETQTRTGKNPGREKAAQAVRAVHTPQAAARCVVPEGLPDGGSDFNDLAAHAGSDAVRRLIEAACAALEQGEGEAPARKGRQQARGAVNDGGAGRTPPPANDASSSPESSPGERDPFSLDEAGVWFTARDAEGNDKRPQWLCARLAVSARTRADDGSGWGYLLEFQDPDGQAKTWAMPSALLSGEGSEWAGRLRDMGLRMAPGSRARNLIAQYIDTRNPRQRVTCTDRVGWHGPVFVLPSGSIGASDERRYVFQSETGMEDTFRQHGELRDWQAQVAAPCVGNSRLAFALCCAFAGPMLRLAGMESGGFHLRGDSSKGKTTALRLAASVWGRPSYMQRWRTTDNALEATAVQHCDGLLILDEFGQLDPRVAGECAYMLANDQEKGRATRNGLVRKRRTWRLLFLSSGEISLADHMAEVGKRTRAGQEVRMIDIPLDAGAGMGGLESLHDADSPAALADAMVRAAARHYGTAGQAWLEWACAQHETLPDRLQQLVDRYRAEIVPEAASEQVRRAGSRFALVAAAGELATQAGITGWPEGEALAAARRCFNAWLGARGHMDNGEDAAMLRQVRAFLEKNGDALFTWTHRAMDDHKANTPLRAGFRRMVDAEGKAVKVDAATDYLDRRSTSESSEARNALVEYLILPEAFRRDVCKGFDSTAVARLLQKRGHLVHEADRLTIKHRLPGLGKAPCYHVKPSVLGDDL
ncbi:DUF927 domain-containing protein [Methylibium rhizosphaerae]|uniref:DUF927 domain-containing protein n=1 Tax=Methylibium rhizosphaerae TaxID=2570323 RepID=UPI00112E9971|nr:DUF927 domain-containing protein [Methylibium rhizosphaerae]